MADRPQTARWGCLQGAHLTRFKTKAACPTQSLKVTDEAQRTQTHRPHSFLLKQSLSVETHQPQGFLLQRFPTRFPPRLPRQAPYRRPGDDALEQPHTTRWRFPHTGDAALPLLPHGTSLCPASPCQLNAKPSPGNPTGRGETAPLSRCERTRALWSRVSFPFSQAGSFVSHPGPKKKNQEGRELVPQQEDYNSSRR